MSQPNIICLVRQIRRKALLRNGMCTEAPRGVDSRRGEGPDRDGWKGDGADRPPGCARPGLEATTGWGAPPRAGWGCTHPPFPHRLQFLTFANQSEA